MELGDFTGLALVPILIALGELVKRQGFPAAKLPLVVLALGIVLNVGLAYYLGTDTVLAALVGLVAGLTASGLYSSSKSLAGR